MDRWKELPVSNGGSRVSLKGKAALQAPTALGFFLVFFPHKEMDTRQPKRCKKIYKAPDRNIFFEFLKERQSRKRSLGLVALIVLMNWLGR